MGSATGWTDTATGATLAMVQPRSDEEKAFDELHPKFTNNLDAWTDRAKA